MAKKKLRRGVADQLVPVYSPKLRAAMADGRVRLADLARKLKASPQAIAYLAEGENIKRCRASRRARLARLLHVTEQWLAEPAATFIPFFPLTGEWKGEIILPVTNVAPLASPRTQLATRRLLLKCVEACDRDVANPALREAGIEETASIDDLHHHVARCIRQLVEVEHLRQDLLVGSEFQHFGIFSDGRLIRSHHLPTDQDEEEAAVDLIAAWEQILEPWFSGKAALNYRRLREKAGFPVPPEERRSDTNPYIVVQGRQEGEVKS